MYNRRVMPDAIILPDETIFLVNGSEKGRVRPNNRSCNRI